MPEPKSLIPILMHVLDFSSQGLFAEDIAKVSSSYLSSTKKAIDPKALSKEVKLRFVDALRNRFPESDFSEEDLDLDNENFVNRFPRTKINYKQLRSVAGLPPEEKDFGKLACLVGEYIRIYLALSKKNIGSGMIALDHFSIKPSKISNILDIFQNTNEFTSDSPKGSVRLFGETFILDINFNSEYPPTTCLSRLQVGNSAHAFVAGSLDIKFDSGAIVARPMVFIKVAEIWQISATYEADSSIYKVSKSLIDRVVIQNGERYEMVFRSELLPDDLVDWHHVYSQLKPADN